MTTNPKAKYLNLLEETLLKLSNVPGPYAEAEIGLLSAILEYEHTVMLVLPHSAETL